MTDEWDFYFLRVDDRPASIYVDLGAVATAPLAHLPHMAYVRLNMLAPRDDGLSSQGEFDTLVLIEDALKDGLVDARTDYVGRCTTDGCRDFFFYVAEPADWPERVAACLRAFPAYRHEAGTREDPGWSAYFDYLYPSEADQQTIQNRHVCDNLQSHGDALTKPREIDHWACFPDARSRDAFVEEAQRLGFALRAQVDNDGERPCGVQIFRTDVPSHGAIDGVTLPLHALAVQLGGEYDGWETAVLT